jgi:hypothetical protein
MNQNMDCGLIRRQEQDVHEIITQVSHPVFYGWRIYLRIDSKERFTSAFARSIL